MKKEKDKEKKCNCGEDCKCNGKHEHHKSNCDCGNEHCDCNHQPTIEDYQKAFDQFEQALIKVDADLTKAKQEAEENQRIAIGYRKDLERFKERNKNIEVEAKQNATEDIVIKIIPILDQFEVALGGGGDEATKKGYQMIYTSLKKVVESYGATEIEALGKPFDSNVHNAVSKAPVDNQKQDGIVTKVYQKGYKLNDKVIRYAAVEIGEFTK